MRRAVFIGIGLSLVSFGVGRGATAPPGFSDSLVVAAAEVTRPTAVRFHPQTGDLWIPEKGPGTTLGSSRIRVARSDTGTVSTALTLPCVDSYEERGVQDIAFDPDFSSNRYVYLFYTRRYEASGTCAEAGQPPATRNVVARYVETGRRLWSGGVIFRGPAQSDIGIHNGGTLRFLPDGTLLVGLGDAGEDPVFSQPSRDPADLRGKILRITRTGGVPPDNPFVGTPGARPEVWAMGLRNPYRFTVDPRTGIVLLPDVGDLSWEEVNLGLPGADYGWPCYEAMAPNVACDPAPALLGLTFPIYTYGHFGMTTPVTGEAIIGGPVYRDGNFPPEYEGAWFFADHVRGWLRRARITGTGQLQDVEDFMTGLERPVDLELGPDGCLYYVLIARSQVHRVCYAGGNNGQPRAAAAVVPSDGPAPLSALFDARGSTDPDGDPLAVTWDFGDGQTGADPLMQHDYPAPGVYWAGLTVNDQTGMPNAADGVPAIRIVAGNRPPETVMLAPDPGLTYRAGDTIQFSGAGTDPEELQVHPSNFAWTITFRHGTHTHPFLGPLVGITSGSFVIPAAGEADPNSAYEVRMDVSDLGLPVGAEARLTTTRIVVLEPQVTRLTLAVDPPLSGLDVEFDGQRYAAPHAADSVVHWPRTIGVPQAQTLGSRTFTFDSWSDGGARAHTLPAPATPATWTARLSCPTLGVPQDLAVEPAAGGMLRLIWAPSADPCLADTAGAPRYAIYRGVTARPAVAGGEFPIDPPFTLIGTATTPSFIFAPGAGDEFYLVLEVGRDGLTGPNGHYLQAAGLPVP